MEDLVLQVKIFKPSILTEYFDEKVRLTCYGCKNYGKITRCPPFVESVQYYASHLPKFTNGYLIYKDFSITNTNQTTIRWQSGLEIQQEVIKVRNDYANLGSKVFAAGGGSCKMCAKCSDKVCNFPAQGLIPMEGLGIDVVKLAKYFNINVKFPVKNSFYRIGMVLVDE